MGTDDTQHPAITPTSSARSAVGGAGAQFGDVTQGHSAGRDVYQGLSGDQLVLLLQQQSEFHLTLVAAYERHVTDTAKKLERLRDEQDMARAGERAAREARQRELDRKLAALAVSVAILALAELWLIYQLFV